MPSDSASRTFDGLTSRWTMPLLVGVRERVEHLRRRLDRVRGRRARRRPSPGAACGRGRTRRRCRRGSSRGRARRSAGSAGGAARPRRGPPARRARRRGPRARPSSARRRGRCARRARATRDPCHRSPSGRSGRYRPRISSCETAAEVTSGSTSRRGEVLSPPNDAVDSTRHGSARRRHPVRLLRRGAGHGRDGLAAAWARASAAGAPGHRGTERRRRPHPNGADPAAARDRLHRDLPRARVRAPDPVVRRPVDARPVRRTTWTRSRRSPASRRPTARRPSPALTTPGSRRRQIVEEARTRSPPQEQQNVAAAQELVAAREAAHAARAPDRVAAAARERRPGAREGARQTVEREDQGDRRGARVMVQQVYRLLASDVVWDDLFQAPSVTVLDQEGVRQVTVPSSHFLAVPDLARSPQHGDDADPRPDHEQRLEQHGRRRPACTARTSRRPPRCRTAPAAPREVADRRAR